MRVPSIRLRLALASALVAAVLLGALAALLAARTAEVASAAATQLAVDDLRPYAVDLRQQPREEPDPAAAGVLVLVIAPDGTERRDSMPTALARAAAGVRGVADVAVASGRYRVVERTVDAGGLWHVVAARDLTAGDALVGGVRTTLLVGTPLAVLAIGVAAYLVAGAALAPVRRMRDAAERLRSPGTAGRLPAASGRELAELGTTLNGLIAELRASAEHERRVTADTAHELRTPLAVLRAQVELAERGRGSADLAAIRDSVERLSRLVDDLLLLARAERDEVAGGAEVTALVTEAMSAVDRARLLAGPAVLVDLELAGPESGRVRGIDVDAFARILTNLVANALAAGPATGVVVALRNAPGLLELTVRDDGPGFPPAFLPFAFDRFSRPEGRRSSPSSGAGLGLALVRRLVERAGGEVGAANLRDGGAVVTARLPVDGGGPAGEDAVNRSMFEDSNVRTARRAPAAREAERRTRPEEAP